MPGFGVKLHTVHGVIEAYQAWPGRRALDYVLFVTILRA